MSYFSTALQIVVDNRKPLTQSALATVCGVDPGNFTRYLQGRRRPDVDSLIRFCENLTPEESTALIVAHLMDETPEIARQYIQIVNLLSRPGRKNRKNSVEYTVGIPEQIKRDLELLQKMAIERPEVAESLRSTIRLLGLE